MNDPARGRLAILDRHVEGIDDESRVLRVVDRPAHDFPGEGIHHGATENLSFSCGMFRDVGNPEFVRGEPVEFAVDEVVCGRNAVQPFHLRRPGKSGNPGIAHQNGDEPLADPNIHSEGEFRVHAPGTIGLPRGRVNLPDQSGQPLPAHLRRGQNAVLVFVIAGAADAEKPAADFGPVARLHQRVDYRVNPFGPGRSSPSSFAATFRISTSISSCRIRFFAFANSMLSGVVIPGRSLRSI